jgi:GDP-4-dehydro-6-deoxy-D-mannose reductase
VYNVCTGRAYTLQEVLDALIRLTRLTVEVVVDRQRVRAQDLLALVGSPESLQARTGWRATSPLGQTLEDLLAYWRAKLRVAPPPSPPKPSAT